MCTGSLAGRPARSGRERIDPHVTILLLAVMTVLFSWQSPCARKYTEHYAGPRAGDASNVYSMVYGTVIALLTFAINGFRFAPRLSTVLLGLLCGLALIGYTTSLVKASSRGPYSFMMLSSLAGGLLVPMLYDMLFRGERLSAIQFFGVGLLLASAAVMNLQGLSFRGGKPARSYFPYCLLLFLSNGSYSQLMNLQQGITGGPERAEMIIVTYSFTALGVLVFWLLRRPKDLPSAFRMGRTALLWALAACAICTSATNMLLYLLSIMPSATILYAIDSGGVLALSGFYALFIFHEKPTPSQIVGLCMAVTSVVILNVF